MYEVKLYMIVRVPDDEAKNELKAVERAKEMIAEEIEDTKIKFISTIIKSWFSSEVKKTK